MKNLPIILRVYGERQEDQWSLICLEFNLAVQANSLPAAQKKLHSMIVGYLRDALEGEDRDFALDFLNRRAPLSFWVKYYVAKIRKCLSGHNGSHSLAGREPIPMAPTAA